MKKRSGRPGLPEACLWICLAALLLVAPCTAGQVRFAALGGASSALPLPSRRLGAGDPHQHWASIERDKKLSALQVPSDASKANASRPADPAAGGSIRGGREAAVGLHGQHPQEEHDSSAGHDGHGSPDGHSHGDHGHGGAAKAEDGGHAAEKHGTTEAHSHSDHGHVGGAKADHSGHAAEKQGEAGAAEAHGHGGSAEADHSAHAAEKHGAAGAAEGHGHSDHGDGGGVHAEHGGHAAAGAHGGSGQEHGAKEGHEHAAAEHGHGGSTGSTASQGHGHGEHGHGHSSHGHSKAGSDEAHSVAVGLFAAVTLLPISISMALTEGKVQELTLKMLDTFTSIFLAVLWFNTFQQFLITFRVHTMFPGANIVLAVVNVIVLYIIAQVVSWLWKDETMRLTTFCSCGAHFIAFAGINATGWSQEHMTDVAPQEMDTPAVFLFCLIVAVVLAGLFTTNWLIWRQHSKEETEMNEAIDELEMDIIGLVLSFAVTQAVRTAITGRYPSLHLVQIENGHFKHSAWQRWFMLLWSLVLTVVASWAMPRLSEWAHNSPRLWVKRSVHVMKVVLIMLIAWGFLLWGQWEFYENMFGGHGMFGHMIFAIVATFVCLTTLYCMGIYGPAITTREVRESYQIITTGISLVAAWSWEHCFDMAFDIIGEQYEVGLEGLVPKLILSIVVPAALLPTYIHHVRPRVLEIDEAHVHDEHVSEEIERISRQSSLRPEEVERMSKQASLQPEEVERLKKEAERRLQEDTTQRLRQTGVM